MFYSGGGTDRNMAFGKWIKPLDFYLVCRFTSGLDSGIAVGMNLVNPSAYCVCACLPLVRSFH